MQLTIRWEKEALYMLANIRISPKSTWAAVDSLVEKSLLDALHRVDPVSNLGLGGDSLIDYQFGRIERSAEPQKSPFQCANDDSTTQCQLRLKSESRQKKGFSGIF